MYNFYKFFVVIFTCFQFVAADMSRWYSNITCSSHEECHKPLGEMSNCIHNICQCAVRFHMSDNLTCIIDKGLHENCERNDECYWGPEMMDKFECRDGICSCKDLYLEAGHKICIRYFVSGANSPKPLSTNSIISVLSILLTSTFTIFKLNTNS